MNILPTIAAQFLNRAPIKPTGAHPAWLIGELDASQWKVVTDRSYRDHTGVWRALVTFRWDISLPGGTLADDQYQLLVNQAKEILLRLFNNGRSVVAPSAIPTQQTLLQMIERAILLDPGAASATGLASLDADAMASFASDFRHGGAPSVAMFYPRFREWISRLLKQSGRQNLRNWLRNQNKEVRQRILHFDRPVESDEPHGVPSVLVMESHSFLRWARLALAFFGHYAKDGTLAKTEVAKGIGTGVARLRCSVRFLYELRQYEHATNYRQGSVSRDSTRTERTEGQASAGERYRKRVATRGVVPCIFNISGAARQIASLRHSEVADVDAIKAAVDQYYEVTGGTTRVIPKVVAETLIRRSLEWVFGVAPRLVRLLQEISELAATPRAVAAEATLVRRLEWCLQHVSERRVGGHLPVQFWRSLATEVRAAEASGQTSKLQQTPVATRAMGVVDLLDIHQAVCLSLIALMACERYSEVLDGKDGDLVFERGRWYLEVRIRKHIDGGVRRTMMKPIPPGIAICIHSLIAIRNSIDLLVPRANNESASKLFHSLVKLPRIRSVTSVHAMYVMLETMSEYFDLRTRNGARWRINPHELRKFFAMSFFHDGARENSLPALAWFMGHGDDIAKTWIYIKSDLATEEISSIEATWAAAALRTQPEQRAVGQLASILQAHFGVQRLDVLDEDELQEYLEMLQSRGVYTAELKSIRDGHGQRYTVLVHIKEA